MSTSSGFGGLVERHRARLERHAADRAGARTVAHDLRVHRARVLDRVAGRPDGRDGRGGREREADRLRRRPCGLVEVATRIGRELREAPGAAKAIRPPLEHGRVRPIRCDGHAADRVAVALHLRVRRVARVGVDRHRVLVADGHAGRQARLIVRDRQPRRATWAASATGVVCWRRMEAPARSRRHDVKARIDYPTPRRIRIGRDLA